MDDTNQVSGQILVIDDERGPRESIRILLKNECEVFCADSVDAGIELLKQHSPDVIIMDIRMPGKNGIEGLRAIRELDPVVSIMMFTGYGALETAQDAIRLGANEYLKKPFDTHEIRALVRKHVLRTRSERRRRNAERDLEQVNQFLQNELARKNVLAAMGQKSAELVHDLRNPLMAIMGYMELLGEELKQSREKLGDRWQDAATYMDHIEKSVMRCKSLSDFWLSLSRGKINRVSVGMPNLLDDILRECGQRAAGRRITLVREPEESECRIPVDRNLIERAIQNLVVNALEAVEPVTGLVRVWCRSSADGVDVGVEDNGCGMTEEQIRETSRLVFASRKENGTGLGLFIARQAVEAHEGNLRIESEPGRGTRVTVHLPVNAGAQETTTRN